MLVYYLADVHHNGSTIQIHSERERHVCVHVVVDEVAHVSQTATYCSHTYNLCICEVDRGVGIVYRHNLCAVESVVCSVLHCLVAHISIVDVELIEVYAEQSAAVEYDFVEVGASRHVDAQASLLCLFRTDETSRDTVPMGCCVAIYLIAFLQELYVVQLKSISSESGSFRRNYEAHLHCVVCSDVLCKIRAVYRLYADDAHIGCYFNAWICIGEVCQVRCENCVSILSATEDLNQRTALIVAQSVLVRFVLVVYEQRYAVLGRVIVGCVVYCCRLGATVCCCSLERIVARHVDICHLASLFIERDVRVGRLTFKTPCNWHACVVSQLILVLASAYVVACCSLDRAVVGSQIGSHAHKGVVHVCYTQFYIQTAEE